MATAGSGATYGVTTEPADILAVVTEFGTILTAMVTPFDDRLAVDEQATIALMHHLIADGSAGVVLSGTTGEASTLTDDEKREARAREDPTPRIPSGG